MTPRSEPAHGMREGGAAEVSRGERPAPTSLVRRLALAARRPGAWTALALVAAIGVAWLVMLAQRGGMSAGPAGWIVAWTVMMAAMMLPSAAPFVLLYRSGSSALATAVLAAGYLLVWAVAGIAAYLASLWIPMSASPLVLAVAGIFQLTPAKAACLKKCRTPADFLVQHWGHHALRLGVEHGLWCLGCCWALMAVLVLVGMMGLTWVVGLALLVAIEKLTPWGVALSRVAGAALIVAAILQEVL